MPAAHAARFSEAELHIAIAFHIDCRRHFGHAAAVAERRRMPPFQQIITDSRVYQADSAPPAAAAFCASAIRSACHFFEPQYFSLLHFAPPFAAFLMPSRMDAPSPPDFFSFCAILAQTILIAVLQIRRKL